MISKEQCLENIRGVFTLISILEPDFVKKLLSIEDSTYFRFLEKIGNTAMTNNNLNFLYNELEEYRKDNLEEYKTERKKRIGKLVPLNINVFLNDAALKTF